MLFAQTWMELGVSIRQISQAQKDDSHMTSNSHVKSKIQWSHSVKNIIGIKGNWREEAGERDIGWAHYKEMMSAQRMTIFTLIDCYIVCTCNKTLHTKL